MRRAAAAALGSIGGVLASFFVKSGSADSQIRAQASGQTSGAYYMGSLQQSELMQLGAAAPDSVLCITAVQAMDS